MTTKALRMTILPGYNEGAQDDNLTWRHSKSGEDICTSKVPADTIKSTLIGGVHRTEVTSTNKTIE
jgi:hypothetical protein